MKKLILALMSVSVNCFASSPLTGKVLLNGKLLDVSVNTDLNSSMHNGVKLGSDFYNIDQQNDSVIGASNSKAGVNVYIGDAFDGGIMVLTKPELVQRLELKNGAEINCVKGQSKGFIVYNRNDRSIGNCIN